jgi:hypothetical protein
MEITPIGWILLPLGAALFLVAPGALYQLTIFFLPFSATAIANIGSSDSASGVQASMFFGALWMLKEMPALVSLRSVEKDRLRTPVRQLVLFVYIVAISLIMPMWINGHLVIESPEFATSGSEPLQFTSRHLTQTFYLVYGVVFAVMVAIKNYDSRQLVRSLRTFLISAIFVSCWGFFQLSCWILNVDYPAYIFNTSASDSAMGFSQEIREMGLKRISSVATEPSMFAQVMLVAMAIALFALISARPLISKTWDRIALAVIFGALLISTSTMAYAGLAVVFGLYLCALAYLQVLRPRYAVAFFAFWGLSLYGYFLYVPAQQVFESMVMGKGESYSALARVNSILLARDYFLRYPLLGVGWGSVTSHDLVFKLLSNTGVIGLFVFLLFIMTALRRLYRAARNPGMRLTRVWPLCMLAAMVMVIFTNLVGGFAFTYGHLWFVFGLAMAVTAYRPWPALLRHIAIPMDPELGTLGCE